MADETGGRKQRLFKNGIYSALAWIFPLLLAVSVTPIVVKGLGAELYGLYAVVLGFISYSFTFGIGKTAAKFVAEFRATDQHEKVSEVISSIFWLSLCFALAGSLIIAVTARPIVENVLLIEPDLRDQAVIALYLACATIVMIMLSQVAQFVLQGLQRFDRYLMLTNLSGFLIHLGSVAIVLGGGGVSALLVWHFFVTLAVGLMFWLNAWRLMPDLRLVFKIDKSISRPVLKYAFSIVIYQIFANLLFLFERGWIVRRFGSAALTFYVVPMALGIYLHMLVASVVMALFPVVNELLTDRERLVRLYRMSSKVVLTLVAFTVVSAWVSGRLFLTLWMSEEFADASYRILSIHMLTFGVVSMVAIIWQIAESFRAASLNAIFTFLWMAISVPLMIALSGEWQTMGVAAARLCGVIVFVPLIFYVERRFLGGPYWGFWVSTLARIAAASLAAGLSEWAILSQFEASWPILFLTGILGFAAYAMVLFASGFLSLEEKALLRGLVSRIK